MTEHESEQLYHDLRQKLEGYGSAPPESVWAGIRQQVPARRPWKRRLMPLLLLLGFFTAGGLLVGTRYWPGPPGLSAADGPPARRAGSTPASATGPATSAAPVSADAATVQLPGNSSALQAGSSASASGPAVASARAASSAATGSRPARAPHLLVTPMPRHRRLTATETQAQTDAKAPRRKRRLAAAGWLAGLAANRPAQTGARATADGAAGPASGARAARWGRPTDPDAATRSGLGSKRGRTTFNAPISNAPLALRNTLPAALDVEEPEVTRAKRRANRRPTRRELRLRNWSVQVGGGPALTYRLLGSPATQLERLERPGAGFSSQLTGTYAFSRQLAVSAGIGYAQYANTLRYRLRKDSAETTQPRNFRDVYQFVTIPVQAQLTLGRSIRWRYGLLGGGTLALLTGARTTEGSACSCGQRQWTRAMTDTVFSRTNLALTGGAFASYQVGLGQWLTIRPQAQLFLNSLTAPSGTRAPRRPWGLGVQLGYSWDLDPRKR